MIGEKLSKYEVAVLQSVANCVGSIGQVCRKKSIAEWLEEQEDESLDAALAALEKECLIQRETFRGDPDYYSLTEDGYRCNRIDVSGIMV